MYQQFLWYCELFAIVAVLRLYGFSWLFTVIHEAELTNTV